MRYLFDDYVLDTDRRELHRGADAVSVTPQVFDILDYLISNRERVVSKDDLMNAIWKGRIVSDAALTTRMNGARAAVGDCGETQRLIKTIPRKGFRFVGAVREVRKPTPAVHHRPEAEPAALPLPDKPSIAVLPFASLSSDSEQEHFADGIVEEITMALAHFRWLFVIARNSSFAYKGRVVDVKQVGRELGVRYVLEGSVRKAGNRIRIAGQLIDAETGTHLWADRFEGPIEDMFDLQDNLTSSVIGAIAPKLQREEIKRARRKPPESLDAYDHYLRGLAKSRWLRVWRGEPDLALEHSAHAVRLSPLDPPLYYDAQGAMAYAHFLAGRYDAAVSCAESALRGQTSFLLVTCISAASNALAGRREHAQRSILQALECNPDIRANLTNLAPFRRAEDFAIFEKGLCEAGLPDRRGAATP
ncbi:winged helix-turn-helix domain-containing protein [Bradyrhizobium liaoningense]|uniref:winged helix-turn-helix domain-containing protein n=1 Tax=Bradyrhizobium liaoningense TaxID=43992 RepID=UPI001BA6C30D|nr:winged helix-turn-helix domain-containing protein [Bradyrhizobium liaoningense]MBR0907550.1 winged helix-turn-helix domain-containing protein [Bradyrhizobium liaoningense]